MALFSFPDAKAKDIMKAAFATVDANESVSTALNKLDRENVLSVLVYENGKYAGYFGYKQLVTMHTSSPETTKVKGLVARGPSVPEDAPLPDVVESMYVNDAKIIPVLSNGRAVGVIETSDILGAIPRMREAQKLRIREVMTPDPLSLREEEPLASALSIFREKGIVRLPIVDKDHHVQGMLESHELVREFRSKPDYGVDMFFTGNSGGGRVGAMTPGGLTVAAKDVPAKSLMKNDFVSCFPDDSLVEKVPALANGKSTTLVVMDEDKQLNGIVTPKDLLQYLMRFKRQETFAVQSSGIEREESLTDFQRSKVASMIEEVVNRLEETSRVQAFSIHVKTTTHTGGKQHLYHVFCKAVTDDGTFSSRESEWDFVLASGNALKELESQVAHKISKKKDVARVRNSDAKKK